jgi:hypothetical protein
MASMILNTRPMPTKATKEPKSYTGLRRAPLNKLGRLGRLWAKARRELKAEFAAMGITTCELRFKGCWIDNRLGFLHIKKRRNLRPDELKIVALGCNPCHDRAELLPEHEMTELVLGIIANRERPNKAREMGLLK